MNGLNSNDVQTVITADTSNTSAPVVNITQTAPPPAPVPAPTVTPATAVAAAVDGYAPPDNILAFTQSVRTRIAVGLLSTDIESQDPKKLSVAIKALRDMDAADVAQKRLVQDNRIAGDNAAIARDLIAAAYANNANGQMPHTQTPPPNAPDVPNFTPPADLLPGFVPNSDIQGVGVADRTYEEVMAAAPPKPTT